MKNYGVWWNIAGGGWVSALPDHHGQVEMFGGCHIHSHLHVPKWGGKPIVFSKEEAEVLAEDWSPRGWGTYVAIPLNSCLPKGELTFKKVIK